MWPQTFLCWRCHSRCWWWPSAPRNAAEVDPALRRGHNHGIQLVLFYFYLFRPQPWKLCPGLTTISKKIWEKLETVHRKTIKMVRKGEIKFSEEILKKLEMFCLQRQDLGVKWWQLFIYLKGNHAGHDLFYSTLGQDVHQFKLQESCFQWNIRKSVITERTNLAATQRNGALFFIPHSVHVQPAQPSVVKQRIWLHD